MATTWVRPASTGTPLTRTVNKNVLTESRGSIKSPNKGPASTKALASVSGSGFSSHSSRNPGMSGLGSMFGRQSPMADSPSHSSIHGVRRGRQERRGVAVASTKEVAPILGDEVKPETALARATPVRDAVRKLLNAKPKPEAPISYAQLLEYLQNKRIVRLSIHDHGKEAIGRLFT